MVLGVHNNAHTLKEKLHNYEIKKSDFFILIIVKKELRVGQKNVLAFDFAITD